MSVESVLRSEALERDNHRCVWCGDRWQGDRLEMAHIVPKGSGGQNVIENVLCLCPSHHDMHDGREARKLHEYRLLMLDYVAVLYGYDR